LRNSYRLSSPVTSGTLSPSKMPTPGWRSPAGCRHPLRARLDVDSGSGLRVGIPAALQHAPAGLGEKRRPVGVPFRCAVVVFHDTGGGGGKELEAEALARRGASPMDLTGKPMKGFVWVRSTKPTARRFNHGLILRRVTLARFLPNRSVRRPRFRLGLERRATPFMPLGAPAY
jgi:hypothetical protein